MPVSSHWHKRWPNEQAKRKRRDKSQIFPDDFVCLLHLHGGGAQLHMPRLLSRGVTVPCPLPPAPETVVRKQRGECEQGSQRDPAIEGGEAGVDNAVPCCQMLELGKMGQRCHCLMTSTQNPTTTV